MTKLTARAGTKGLSALFDAFKTKGLIAKDLKPSKMQTL